MEQKKGGGLGFSFNVHAFYEKSSSKGRRNAIHGKTRLGSRLKEISKWDVMISK